MATFIGYIALGIVFLLGLWGCPQYMVYMKETRGQADLAEAEFNRQIRVREAEAEKDAAVKLAEAEVERAKGVAEANKIIGDSLRGNESYLRYLWVQGLNEKEGQVIYIPTEAQLPVMEAGRLLKRSFK